MTIVPDDLLLRLDGIGTYARMFVPGVTGGGCAAYCAAVARGLYKLSVPVRGLLDGFSDGRSKIDLNRAHTLVQFRWSGRSWVHDSGSTVPAPEIPPENLKPLTYEALQTLGSASVAWASDF